MAEIKFENITKRFGKVIAVNDFNLTIKDKEFLTLVGPSGCGKTTTLNMLAGLEDPTEGLIYIDGKIANETPPGKRDIAMVFQSYALYPHMSVYQNIGFGLKVRGIPNREIDDKVKEAACLLGIDGLLERKPRELSGGQRQRVALGRAITRTPKVFLLDEPLSNLDAKLRVQTRADLKLLFQRLSGTVVYVTHDQAEAMTLSDRVVVMKDGLIMQVGEPLEVYDNPKNLFVAGFLGSPPINLINCRFIEGPALQTSGFKFNISEPKGKLIKEKKTSDELVLGIRPEDIKIVEHEREGQYIDAIIQIMEQMGNITIVYLSIDTIRLVVTTDRTLTHRSGEKVKITFNENKLHVFDSKTEEAIF
ncbi:MAG: ABC transporter ATP-binding protein [Actinobacteria bacterium]|nr:ABC transporter ATP-binding protein [Actinomycetota bacterium]